MASDFGKIEIIIIGSKKVLARPNNDVWNVFLRETRRIILFQFQRHRQLRGQLWRIIFGIISKWKIKDN